MVCNVNRVGDVYFHGRKSDHLVVSMCRPQYVNWSKKGQPFACVAAPPPVVIVDVSTDLKRFNGLTRVLVVGVWASGVSGDVGCAVADVQSDGPYR